MYIYDPAVRFAITLIEDLANYGPYDKSDHIHSFTYCLWLLALQQQSLVVAKETIWLTKPKIIICPFTEQFTEPYSNFQRELEDIPQTLP